MLGMVTLFVTLSSDYNTLITLVWTAWSANNLFMCCMIFVYQVDGTLVQYKHLSRIYFIVSTVSGKKFEAKSNKLCLLPLPIEH